MKILYIDCFLGFDAQMLLGAMISAGADIGKIESAVRAVDSGAAVNVSTVQRFSMEAQMCSITTANIPGETPLAEAKKFADSVISAENGGLARRAAGIMTESAEHSPCRGKTIPTAELMNGLCCANAVFAAAADLGADYVISSAICDGIGTSDSGMPIPSPITLETARRYHIPISSKHIDFELTGGMNAAILAAFAAEYGTMPQMDIISIGYGAGCEIPEAPNLIRAVLGSCGNSELGSMFETSDLFSEISEELSFV